jgi:hypothetical protein
LVRRTQPSRAGSSRTPRLLEFRASAPRKKSLCPFISRATRNPIGTASRPGSLPGTSRRPVSVRSTRSGLPADLRRPLRFGRAGASSPMESNGRMAGLPGRSLPGDDATTVSRGIVLTRPSGTEILEGQDGLRSESRPAARYSGHGFPSQARIHLDKTAWASLTFASPSAPGPTVPA